MKISCLPVSFYGEVDRENEHRRLVPDGKIYGVSGWCGFGHRNDP